MSRGEGRPGELAESRAPGRLVVAAVGGVVGLIVLIAILLVILI